MKKKDYYEILEISRDANTEDIKKNYRKLSKKYHPDISKDPNATEKFKEVQEAYQVLNDPVKKDNYDRFGQTADEQQNGGFGGFQQGFNSTGSFDFGDIFENFFGNQSSHNRDRTEEQSAVQDINLKMDITFMEAVLGSEKEIKFNINKDCEQCHGTGAKTSHDLSQCSYCSGKGYINTTQRISFFGNINTQQACPKCKGKKFIILNKCTVCKGKKRIILAKQMKIKIPAGIQDGVTLKSVQNGNEGHLGSRNSDLYIEIHVLPHDIFKREKQDIISYSTITFSQAVLGFTINVPTIYGDVALQIPAGTQTHTKFKLKNKGVVYANSPYHKGDHYIIVKIVTPTKLSTEQKLLFQKLQELENNNHKRGNRFFNFI